MTSPRFVAPRAPGLRRGLGATVLTTLSTVVVCAVVGPAIAAAGSSDPRKVVALLAGHIARAGPDARAHRIEAVSARRPLTRTRTVLPVLGGAGRGDWLRVRLPGRPNGHSGWISTKHTRIGTTEWRIRVDVSARRVTVYRLGRAVRRFRAIVGRPSTPTPRGRFFVEEALTLASTAPGSPFALATSARSNVFQEFEGGPGQVALHGTGGLPGALGRAASHGCVRLGTRAITWLARRIGAGVPLTIVR